MIEIEFDELALYYGEDYYLNDSFAIKQPTIGQIIDYGESKYWDMVNTLTIIPSDVKAFLYDTYKIYYDEISDFDLFMLLSRNFTQKDTEILFGDIDLSQYTPMFNNKTQEPVLYNKDTNSMIDSIMYMKLSAYLCRIHNFVKKPMPPANKGVRRILIDDDRSYKERHKNDVQTSKLLPLVSAAVNSAGFKYKKNELKECGIVEFMDSINRLQIIEQANAIMHGAYSGMVDFSKNSALKAQMNWMRPIELEET